MVHRTDWNLYYQKNPALSRLTRPIILKAFLDAFRRYSVPKPVVAELGGAGSRVFDAVMENIHPAEYHVVDNNEYGLELFRRAVNRSDVFFHNQDVLRLELELRADTVFSLGLIEHFDTNGTRQAIWSHLGLLKPGGIVIMTFPTPTLLYRLTRGVAELWGKWIFHDERPLRLDEVKAALHGHGEILTHRLIWLIGLTQTLVVIRKGS